MVFEVFSGSKDIGIIGKLRTELLLGIKVLQLLITWESILNNPEIKHIFSTIEKTILFN